MALTRTHNLDVVNDDLHVETLYSSLTNGFETVEMGIADPSVIFSMLSDLSSDRGQYALRETFSNAYDATIRANPNNPQPVEINLDKSIEKNSLVTKLLGITETVASLTVTDHGCGMTPDEVRENFLQYGGSNKRDDVNAIGSKGLGSKAPLAICDSFHIRTVKDGVATSAIISKNPKKTNTATLAITETDDTNGTQVTVPIADEITLSQMNNTLQKIRTFCCDVPLIINGQPIAKSLPTVIGEAGAGYIYVGKLTIPTDDEPLIMRVWEPDPEESTNKRNRSDTSSEINFRDDCFPVTSVTEGCLDLLIGGYTYTLDTHYGMKNPLIAIDPGWLDFTPSRDEIKKNKTYEDFIRTVSKNWSSLDHATALAKWFTTHDEMALIRFIANYEPYDPSASHYSYSYRNTREMEDDHTLTVNSSSTKINIPLADIEHAHPGITKILAMEKRDFQQKLPMIITFARETNNNRAITFVNNNNLKQKEIKDVLAHHDSRVIADAGEWITKLAKSLIRYTPHEFAQLYVINEIPEETPMSAIAKAMPDFFDDLERCDERKSKGIVVIPEIENAQIPDYVEEFLKNRITYMTMDELNERGRDMRRAKNRARRQRQETQKATGYTVRRTVSDETWRSDQVCTLRIPDTSYDIDQLLAYATGRDHALDKDTDSSTYSYSYYRTNRLWAQSNGFLSVATKSKDTPLESCAIVLQAGGNQSSQPAYYWASLIAMSRKAGNPIVPDSVTHVVLTGDRQTTQRQVENYIILGATILQDMRDKVKRREHTVLNDCPYLTSLQSGWKIGITNPKAIIGNDAVIKMFLILQEAGKMYGIQTSTQELLSSAYMLLKCVETSNNKSIQDKIIQPLQETFDNPRMCPEFTPWTVRTNNIPVEVTQTGIEIISDNTLSEEIKDNKYAIKVAKETMQPIINIFNMKSANRANTLSDENIIAIRDMIGSSIEYNTLLTMDNMPETEQEERETS